MVSLPRAGSWKTWLFSSRSAVYTHWGSIVLFDPRDRETPAHAFETLGYNTMKRKYGIKVINLFERPYDKVTFRDGTTLNFSTDFLKSDFVVNIPVLKTHAQTIVTLGIKNLKGTLDIDSRKKCHSADTKKDLHYMIARLQEILPAGFTLIDGIFTNERGPGIDGKIRRDIFEAKEQFPTLFMKKYEGKPDFDMDLFRVK